MFSETLLAFNDDDDANFCNWRKESIPLQRHNGITCAAETQALREEIQVLRADLMPGKSFDKSGTNNPSSNRSRASAPRKLQTSRQHYRLIAGIKTNHWRPSVPHNNDDEPYETHSVSWKNAKFAMDTTRLCTLHDDGYDWDTASQALAQHIPRKLYAYASAYASSWNWQPPPTDGPTLADLMQWMWTPETASAFILLTLVLAVFLCCWVSHKIGEFMFTAVAGFTAVILLILVVSIFVSQWA